MKKYQLMFFAFLLSQLSIAQYNEVLNFGVPNNESFVHQSVIDSSGNMVVSVRIGNDLHLASYDPNNNLNWSKIVLNTTSPVYGKVYASINGSVFVRTTKQVMKLDSGGNILWSKELDNSGVGLSKACALPDGGLAVMTSNIASSIIVLDPNGNVSWSKDIETSGSGYSIARKILISPQNNILTFCQMSGVSSVLLTLWDLNGNVLSEKQYEYGGTSFTSSAALSAKVFNNGHLYFTGYQGGDPTQPGSREMVIYHFDQDLNFVNGKLFGNTFDEEGRDLVEDEDGNLIAIGIAKSELNSEEFLKVMKLSPSLDTLFTKHYGDTAEAYSFSSINRMDTIIYASGYGSYSSHFGNRDGRVIKTNKEFDLSCGLIQYQTNVSDISVIPANVAVMYPAANLTFSPYSYEQPSSLSIHVSCSETSPSVGVSTLTQENYSVYPNPFSSDITITADKVFDLVQIYASNGKLVIQKEVKNTETIVNGEELESGVYFVRIIGNENILNKKLIKE